MFRDDEIARPFFADVHAPNGVAVTRNHPPRAGVDATDHATMHPGIWLAFGDIGGVDFWRNKGRIEHQKFLRDPEYGPNFATFSLENAYIDDGRVICTETRVVSIRVGEPGIFLLIDSEFKSDAAFAFGDQEEMGLGVRVATPMTVETRVRP